METLLSYSLKDLLLFSTETWRVLFVEYTQTVFLFSFLVLCCYSITVMLSVFRPTLSRMFNVVTQLLLLLSCVSYYKLFYEEINHYAGYLVAFCALHIVVSLACFAWGFRRKQAGIFGLDNSVGRLQKHLWILLLPLIFTMVLMAHQHSDIGEWLLPGWYAGTSLILLMHLQLINGERWLLGFPATLVLIESITLKLIAVTAWWLLILMLAVSFGALILDISAAKKRGSCG